MKTKINSRLKRIERAVFIHNEYYRVAGPILEHIKTECKKFIGKKIQLQKGLSPKFYNATKIERDSWANLHYADLSCSYHDLSVEISLYFSDGNMGCTYEKRSFYFGKVDDNGVLISINDNCKAESEPMDFQTELQAIAAYLKAEKIAEELEDKIRLSRDEYKYVSIEDITGKRE